MTPNDANSESANNSGMVRELCQIEWRMVRDAQDELARLVESALAKPFDIADSAWWKDVFDASEPRRPEDGISDDEAAKRGLRTSSWKAAVRRLLPLAVLTLAMIVAVVSLLVSRRENNQLREQAVGTAALRDMVAQLRSRNQTLTRMQLAMQPTQYERENQIYVNFPLISTDREVAPGKVKVRAKNVRFSSGLRWEVDGVVSEHTIDAGESILELPSGNSVTFFVRPGFTSLWLQPVAFGVIRNAKWQFYGSVLGKQTLMLEDGDELIVNFDHPSPPWNAVCIPVRNQWVLVTLERPWATLDLDKWIRKEWQGQEELPNTALFWAREGIDGLAKELAASFVERRNDPALRGRVRGKMHTSLTVGAANNDVIKPFQEITADEMARELKTAFTLLREQSPPYGPSIAEEIARAKAILQSRGVKVSE